MIPLLQSLRTHLPLLRDFVRRDLRARYVGSSMGFFWSVIFPVVNLFVYMFIFRLVLKQRWEGGAGGDAGPKETALVMLTGILVWSAFAETLSRSTNCLVENSNLIQKVVFPSEILPFYLAISSLINMLVGMPIVLLGMLVFGEHGWSVTLVCLPLLVVLQVVFTIGLGYFLAAFNLVLRDTFHVIGVLTTVWMFLTPIFYPASVVENAQIPLPAPFDVKLDPAEQQSSSTWYQDHGTRLGRAMGAQVGAELGRGLDLTPGVPIDPEQARQRGADATMRLAAALSSEAHAEQVSGTRPRLLPLAWVLEVNPMHWLIDSYRRVLIFGQWPEWLYLLRFALVALVALFVGARVFWSQKRRFPDLL